MAQKFDFPTSFDGSAALQRAAARKERLFTEAEMETIRQESWQKGEADGRLAAEQAIGKELTAITGKLHNEMLNLGSRIDALTQQTHQYALELAVTIARKFVPEWLNSHGLSEVEARLRQALPELHAQPRLVVRISESHLPHLQARLEDLRQGAGFDGLISLVSDAALVPGDCRLEWQNGGQEHCAARIWLDLDKILTDHLPPASPSLPPSLPEN